MAEGTIKKLTRSVRHGWRHPPDKKALHYLIKRVVFSPLPHHICGGVLLGADSLNFRQQSRNARSVAAAPKTNLNNNARN
jgi:hypothetical protein